MGPALALHVPVDERRSGMVARGALGKAARAPEGKRGDVIRKEEGLDTGPTLCRT
ncbi:hypothetical protein GCM10017557_69630 [Streptomyces aurantiacus]|uniref:Uncharacterized protein n=1 Tax=Streptomyces aurantiacus TaxID=47760 RepID=A0A7G1PDF0_9ACTN|nr:hypothetical protein GCM10017557_69630 [Streptomyces aurantiacus]